ncbi:F-box only protein 48 isoform X4 [Numida meleagris]|uniref:F-box only protein 48 isoform X4 n=1 Tax=Numida meleagris TaxID=8996 RepID=UPI000B3DC94C|nr:F-box only protein 48 isoform X4 [Numida meleagris]
MQETPKRNKQSLPSPGEPTLLPPDKKKRGALADFVALLPPEVSVQIFRALDIRSLCSAAMTCKRWQLAIDGNDWLWKSHCLTVRAVCQREIDGDRGSGYSWKHNVGVHKGRLERQIQTLERRGLDSHLVAQHPKHLSQGQSLHTWRC